MTITIRGYRSFVIPEDPDPDPGPPPAGQFHTSYLHALLAELDFGDVLHLGPYEYLLDYTVKVPDGIEINGHGAIFRQPTDGRELGNEAAGTWPDEKNYETGLRGRGAIKTGDDCVLRNITVMSNNYEAQRPFGGILEAQHGFSMGSRCLAEDVNVYNVWGDSCYCRGDDTVYRRIVGEGTGRMSLAFTDGADFLAEDCSFTRAARSIIDIEPVFSGGELVDGVIIRDCTFGTHGHGFSGGSGGAVIAGGGSGLAHNVLIDNCTSQNDFVVGVSAAMLGRKTNWEIRDCAGGGSANRQTMTFDRVVGVKIVGCEQEFHGKGTIYAVLLKRCCGNPIDISGNNFFTDDPETVLHQFQNQCP